MKYKKIITLFLGLLFFSIVQIFFVSSTVSALTTSSESDFTFDVSTGTITGYKGAGGDVVIPSTIGGVNVTSIGDFAFSGSNILTSVTIPDSVTSIGYASFGFCSSLTDIIVKSDNALYSSEDGVLFNKTKTELLQYPAGKNGIYSIPNSVTLIASYAFGQCSGLTNVTIPSSVVSIGGGAFAGCSGLTSVTIPNSVTSIDSRAFSSCSSLTDIIVESDNVLYSSEDGVLFDKTGTELIQYPAGKNGVYSIPNSVTSIDDYAFDYCTGLISVTIPSSVTSIGDYAFLNCSSLEYVYFEGNAPALGSNSLDSTKSGFTVYYNAGATGFSNPWNGYQTAIDGTHVVTYNGNGNTGGITPVDTNAYTQGSTVIVLGNTGDLTKIGCTFIGWNTAADRSGINYAAGATLTIGEADITLYAQWTSNPVNIGFNPASYTVNESGGTAELTVTRERTTSGATTVDYATSDGTAAAGRDYTTTNGTLTFADGETSKVITVPIIDEGISNGESRSFTVNLSNPSSGSITTGSATVVINDNSSSSVVTVGVGGAGGAVGGGGGGGAASTTTSSSQTSGQVSVERLYGNDRYSTAVAISTKEWQKSDNVILASGTDYADALASVTLSYLKNCPILLTGRDTLNNDTLNEIQRLGSKNIYIIGGNGVISDDIENNLKQSYNVERIAGTDRYKTAVAVGEELKSQVNIDTVVITSGSNFPDALAIAPFAAKMNMPILYTDKDNLNSDTENLLRQWGVKNIIITGGTGVISQNVEDYIKNTMGLNVERISGSNRYLTSLEIAKYYSSNCKYTGIVIATGDDYADALAGSTFAAYKVCPVLLVSENSVEEDILNYLKDLKLNNVYILGGPGAISEDVKTEIYNAYK